MSDASDNNKHEDKDIVPPESDKKKTLYRLPEQGMIAGVLAGLAEYFEIDATVVRVLFVVGLFLTGGGIVLAYIIAAVIMPVPGGTSTKGSDIGDRIEGLASEMKSNGRIDRTRNWFGIGLVIIGAWLLIGMFWPDWLRIRWDIFWPSLLIVVGLLFIFRGKK